MSDHRIPVSWKQAIRLGLIGGGVALLVSLIGMTEVFGTRDIVSGIFSMGQVIFLAPLFLLCFRSIRSANIKTLRNVLPLGLLPGLIGGAVLSIFIAIGHNINLRVMFVNCSPRLYEMLSFGLPYPLGTLSPLIAGLIVGGLSAGIFLLPIRLQKALIQASLSVILIGLLRDLIMTVISRWGVVAYLFEWLFATTSGLTILGAVLLFFAVGIVQYWRWGRPKREKIIRPARQQKTIRWATLLGIAVILLLLPPILGVFFSDVLDNVGLFILMGLGLNIVVGFAGLLDLGYVAFYAIGAYTMGILTSPELGGTLNYWQALPFALVMSVIAGFILGLPVLKMRGDYLAIVTLGFGEIVRLMALSDWLRPYLGGTQGIQLIPRPRIGSLVLASQQQLYYLIIVGVAIAAFIAWRLKDTHVGRSWMALREDEDVAQAMGLDLVATKLLAFATGAFFAGLSGTIFAAKITAVYPHSFNFMVSINVLSLIIIGGMGSIPGVVVGSLALVGLPELLREFAEFRLLVYGAVLVVMMLTKPEGLWPEERRKLELHEKPAEIVV